MNLFSDLITAVQDDLTVGNESTLYTPALIKRAINRAYIKAGGLFRWPETEDAKKTSTQALIEYYDYPSTWRPDSIWKLMVDDVDYGDPLSFKDYLYEKEEDIPCGRDYIWASQWRRYFIYPTPTAAGSYNISVWGQKVVDELVEDAAVTIWSYSMPECNDAVVLEAVAILKSKGELEKGAEFRSMEAKQILAVAWGKVRQDQAKYFRTQPMFDVPDYFGGGTTDDYGIGDFK
jgi:hypothetical protein